jgi:alkylation response protein AidB-like acyl-CoA dehydrogenase
VDFEPSDRQQERMAHARQLARDVLAPNAARYDAESTHPVDDFAALREHGYHTMLIPAEYGGWGLDRDLNTYALVMHELAQGASATTTALNMHNFAMFNIAVLGTPDQREEWFARVIEESALVGGWGSEPGAGLTQGRFLLGTTITEVDDGYLVDGAKFFCTLAGVARYAELLVVAPDRVGDVTIDDICSVIVPTSDPGVTISDDWDVLGMRATVSPAVTFDQIRVPRDHRLGTPGDNIFTRGCLQGLNVGYASIYSGLARAALAFATDYAVRKVIGPNGERHAQQPAIQQKIGEFTTMVDAAYTMALRAGWELDRDFDSAVHRQVGGRARAVAMRTVLDVTSRAFEICGGSTIASKYPLGRYFREARSQTLMNPGYDGMTTLLGQRIVEDALAAQRA